MIFQSTCSWNIVFKDSLVKVLLSPFCYLQDDCQWNWISFKKFCVIVEKRWFFNQLVPGILCSSIHWIHFIIRRMIIRTGYLLIQLFLEYCVQGFIGEAFIIIISSFYYYLLSFCYLQDDCQWNWISFKKFYIIVEKRWSFNQLVPGILCSRIHWIHFIIRRMIINRTGYLLRNFV